MIVFRLSKSRFSKDLSGRGAELVGGRWNSKGLPMLYTSSSRALCTAEIAVHCPLGIVPFDYEIIEIEIPETSIQIIQENQLSGNWKQFPHQNFIKKIGDEFLKKNEFLVLKVPSAVVSGDFNYLINPFHATFSEVKIIKIEKFEFDKRLFVR
jgi:RES domain-containing protein